MEQQKENKAFIIRYYNAISGVLKPRDLLKNYIEDESLMEHITFFDAAFPGYEMSVDEMTAEGNRVVVRARFKGCHEGDFNGIFPTHRKVDFPCVVSYEIENNKIVHHWVIGDQVALMEQLGVMSVPA